MELYQKFSTCNLIFLILLAKVVCTPIAHAQQRAPDSPHTFASFVEPDFPFITTTLNADTLGAMYPDHNRIPRCLVLQLDNEAYACFDPDLLRIAAIWTGDFISMLAMPHVSYHKAGNKKNGVPEVLGNPIAATGIYPGWQGRLPVFEDPRPEGPNSDEAGRGPISVEMGRWNGISVIGNQAVLQYEVRGVEVADLLTSVKENEEVGVVRVLDVGAHSEPLSLVLGEYRDGQRMDVARDRFFVIHPDGDTVTAIGAMGGNTGKAFFRFLDGRYITLYMAANESPASIQVVMWKGPRNRIDAFERMLEKSLVMPDYRNGGPARWPESVTTKVRLGPDQGVFAVDELALPLPNPWQRNVRVGALDFFEDGRAAVSTFDGDVWIVDGVDERVGTLTWKRFASGLSEPMSLSIVDEKIYVFGREGIVRLNDVNGDGEADFYENFSNLAVQTGESREYPLSMHALPDGGFMLSKGGALNAGPKTNPPVTQGFRAGGPHSGSILEVSPDGRSIKVVASGLREPYIGVHPETGWITASDQQGNFVPSTPIYFVEEGDFFGVPATAHQMPIPQPTPPLTWVPHQVDPSGTEQVWITSDQMGPLDGTLVHLSYGQPGIYRVYMSDPNQGGISFIALSFSGPLMKGKVHPIDGRLYLAGFQVWDSGARSISTLARVRYTGGELPLPLDLKAGREGVLLRFAQKLNPKEALRLSNYSLKQWNYQRTSEYGSGYFKPSGEAGQEFVPISGVSLSDDRSSIFLHVAGMQEVMQMELEYWLKDSEGDSLTHAVYWTVNHLPEIDLIAEGILEVQLPPEPADLPTKRELLTRSRPTVEKGRQAYERIGCAACHSTDGSTEGRSGASFRGLFGSRRTFTDGTEAIADEDYVRQSILDPSARVVAGKEVEMPSYVGVLNDEEVASLVLFIKSLAEK